MRPFLVGLTGGIATGKSTCRRFIEDLGAITLDADVLAHSVYEKGSTAHDRIVATFGEQILSGDCIDRRSLGRIVFKDPNAMKQLTDIVWPETLALLQRRIDEEQHRRATWSQEPAEPCIVVIEAAVLCDAGWHELMDHVILTYVSDPAIVRDRLLQRNPDLSEEDVKARMQLSEQGERCRSEKVAQNPTSFTRIDSGTSLETFRGNVVAVFTELKTKAAAQPHVPKHCISTAAASED